MRNKEQLKDADISSLLNYVKGKTAITFDEITEILSESVVSEFMSDIFDILEIYKFINDKDELKGVQELLNNRPRKCINYKTPKEMLFAEFT